MSRHPQQARAPPPQRDPGVPMPQSPNCTSDLASVVAASGRRRP